MDMINLIVSLISGAVGGNIAGEGLKDQGLGTTGNSLAGILGGGIGAAILQLHGAATGSARGDVLDAASLIGTILSCAIGGALGMVVIKFTKRAMVRHKVSRHAHSRAVK
jgi:uncharacterized membrane protein YeaQ/YmgE (transglycosylase-associated protein family)